MYIKRKLLVPIHVRKWESAQLGNAQVGRAQKNCAQIFCAQVGTTHFFFLSCTHFIIVSTFSGIDSKKEDSYQ